MTLTVRMTASPINRIGTSWRMAGGSLTEDGESQESAALVEHALFDHLIRPPQHRLRDRQANGLGGL
jgi:hypothetical protein